MYYNIKILFEERLQKIEDTQKEILKLLQLNAIGNELSSGIGNGANTSTRDSTEEYDNTVDNAI